jgi:NADH-quinone oxidoreductase subunit J
VLPRHIGFGIVAVVMVVGALRVVTTKNVVHAALWLVVVLAGAAAQYLLLAGEFVAVTQILVYVGAIMVLFLFGTMLTRALIGKEKDLDNTYRYPAVLVALLLLGVITYALIDQYHATKLPSDTVLLTLNTEKVSDSVFGVYAIPFWGLSILLTAAVIGAIVLARRD